MSEITIVKAIITNDTKQLKYLIKNGHNLNAKDHLGNTPLHIAVLDESRENAVQFSLTNGANINAKNNKQKNPLHIAVMKSNLKMVKLLVKNGSELNSKDERGRTPFYYAKNETIAKCLIKYGADIASQDRIGLTPLHFACDSSSNFELVKLLIKLGVDPNVQSINGISPLHWAVGHVNNLETVRLLIENGADFDAEDRFRETPFLMACKIPGNTEVVKYLYHLGADFKTKDIYKNRPLHLAASAQKNIDTINFLVEIGADVNQRNGFGKTPFFQAANLGLLENMEILLQNGADISCTSKMFLELRNKEILKQYGLLDPLETIIKQHLIKLKLLNLVGDDVFKMWKFSAIECEHFIQACEKEARKLQKMICLNQKMSFADLLTKSEHTVAGFLNYGNMKETLNQVNYPQRFPIYSGLMEGKIKRCTNLAKFLFSGKESLRRILGDYRMPESVLNHILTFLGINDLKNLNPN